MDGTFGATVPMTAPDFVRSVRFGADGGAIYLLANDGLHAYTLDRDTRATTEVTGSPFAMAGGRVLEVDPKGRFLYESGAAGAVYLHRINASTGTVALVDVDGDDLNGVTGYLTGFDDLAFGGGGALLYATGAATTTSFVVATDGLLSAVTTIDVGGDRVAILSL